MTVAMAAVDQPHPPRRTPIPRRLRWKGLDVVPDWRGSEPLRLLDQRIRRRLGIRLMCRRWALSNLVDLTEVLDDHGIVHWLTDGTLLGAMRDDDLIAHDDDTDLGVMAATFSPSVLDALRAKGFSLVRTFGLPDEGLELTLGRHGITTDLFFFYERGHGLYHSAYRWVDDETWERLDYEYPPVHPRRQQLLGRSFWVPDEPAAYLEHQYGPGWTRPERDWDYVDDPHHTIRTGVRLDVRPARSRVHAYLGGARTDARPPDRHGLVLAAGVGTRLDPSGAQPKALATVGDETLVGRLVRQLGEAGAATVTVVVGHQAPAVIAHLDGLPRPPAGPAVSTVVNAEAGRTGNVVSLALGLAALQQSVPGSSVLLVEGDVVVDDEVIAALADHPDDDVALLGPATPLGRGTTVHLDGLTVTDVVLDEDQGEAVPDPRSAKTVNAYKLSPALCRSLIPALDDVATTHPEAYYERALARVVATGRRLTALHLPHDGWVEVDDPLDLADARYRFDPDSRLASVDEEMGGWWDHDFVDASYMRNLHFPPPRLVAHLQQRLPQALGAYGSTQAVLDRELAVFLGTDADRTLALPGLSALLPLLADHLDGSAVLIPSPTFNEYPRLLPRASNYDAHDDLGRLEARLGTGGPDTAGALPDAVVVVNPNNPVGPLHRSEDLAALAGRHPHVTFWVDESFLAFTTTPSLTAVAVPHEARIVVLGSLSKDLGLPGARLGYAWESTPGLLDPLRARLPIWAMSSLTQVLVRALPKFADDYRASLVAMAGDRAHLEALLDQVGGLERIEAHGAHVVVRIPTLPASCGPEVRRRLFDRGFLVKDLSERLDLGCVTLRIAVRRAPEADELVAHLAEIVEQVP